MKRFTDISDVFSLFFYWAKCSRWVEFGDGNHWQETRQTRWRHAFIDQAAVILGRPQIQSRANLQRSVLLRRIDRPSGLSVRIRRWQWRFTAGHFNARSGRSRQQTFKEQKQRSAQHARAAAAAAHPSARTTQQRPSETSSVHYTSGKMQRKKKRGPIDLGQIFVLLTTRPPFTDPTRLDVLTGWKALGTRLRLPEWLRRSPAAYFFSCTAAISSSYHSSGLSLLSSLKDIWLFLQISNTNK